MVWIQCILSHISNHWHKVVLEALWKADDVDPADVMSEIVD